MPIQPSSCGMVRWSVSKPSRGRCASTRSASYASTPTAGPSRAANDSRSARGRNRSRPYGVSRTTTPSGTSAMEPGRQVDDRELLGAVGDLDPVEELHLLQVGDQRLLGARLDVRPDGLAVVDEVEGVLDVAVRGEDQRLGGLARRAAR